MQHTDENLARVYQEELAQCRADSFIACCMGILYGAIIGIFLTICFFAWWLG